MTVCIAAAAETEEGQRALVLCTDRRVGGALGSAETGLKSRYITKGWRLLTSGDEHEIMALDKLYTQRFRQINATKPENLDESMRWPVNERKRQLASEFIRARFATSLEDFQQHAKQRLPDDIFHEAIRAIGDIRTEADVVMAGFSDEYSAEIYECCGDGKVRIHEDFAVIGEGALIATSSLLRRRQDYVTTLNDTLFNVFEAKRLSEAVGSVGRGTSLSVLYPDGTHKYVSSAARTELNVHYKKYGPQSYQSIQFEGEVFKEEDT